MNDKSLLFYFARFITAMDDGRCHKATETVRLFNMLGTDLRLLSLDRGGVRGPK